MEEFNFGKKKKKNKKEEDTSQNTSQKFINSSNFLTVKSIFK